jgi:hypothetical protein
MYGIYSAYMTTYKITGRLAEQIHDSHAMNGGVDIRESFQEGAFICSSLGFRRGAL